ncbi:1327_t:CDS:2 [Paraglomus occultum]|uniref:1327_t:CDS:1 n=1 Tax=Paraglomus occultum TaxID=144539 RepID=A0A9N9GNT2_9GLOM|nr:1327_t:CDS:2 [Paraglomus occultum]
MALRAYFSRITKQDINIKHSHCVTASGNSDPSARDTTFNEFLANCDARFLTELTDYRAKFNTELTSRDENFIAEIQRILTMLNTSTMCNVVSADILKLGMGAIGKDTIKSFYNGGNIRSENLEKIGAWIDNSYTTTE